MMDDEEIASKGHEDPLEILSDCYHSQSVSLLIIIQYKNCSLVFLEVKSNTMSFTHLEENTVVDD